MTRSMKYFLAVAGFACALGVAQQLTVTDVIAIGVVGDKLRANARERDSLMMTMRQIEAQVARDHPGYHFDECSNMLVRDTPLRPAQAPCVKFWER